MQLWTGSSKIGFDHHLDMGLIWRILFPHETGSLDGGLHFLSVFLICTLTAQNVGQHVERFYCVDKYPHKPQTQHAGCPQNFGISKVRPSKFTDQKSKANMFNTGISGCLWRTIYGGAMNSRREGYTANPLYMRHLHECHNWCHKKGLKKSPMVSDIV